MSASSGREGHCERCGHWLDGHAAIKHSKCLKCKKQFEICQVSIHAEDTRGKRRLCFIPCSCGEKYYPPDAKNAIPLAPHEYMPGHPGYRPLSPDEDEYEDTTHYDTQDVSSPPPQGGTWSAGHGRADSGDSEDPLAWSKEKFEQETGSIAGLVRDLDKAHIGESTTSNWSSWSWSKEWGQWVRSREKSTGVREYDYQALSGHWSDWSWSEAWGQWERSAKDPDGNWGYEYKPDVESPTTDNKGKGKEKDPTGPSTTTTLGLEDTSEGTGGTSSPQSASQEGLLVNTVKKEKNKHVFYYFRNEEGKDVQTDARDWKKGSRYFEGKLYECLVYVGKKSGRVYHTWQLGKSTSSR
ncbi:hypothetical protein BDZ45DRAFT_811391 [Acephala macrosclerotiorum]|nr:hypothetical protein BDZ45DRAFT_811391 [Acephala macrosclerotiorum]